MANKKKKDTPVDVGRQRTNEEQMMARQSAPAPTMEEGLMQMMEQQQMRQMNNPTGAIDGFMALDAPIGKEAIQKATQILQKYKEGKSNLETRIVENEQWYKLRHWECMRRPEDAVKPTSAWLFNSIANKHADAMDSFPCPNILPREEGDQGEAQMLTDIVPVILDQNDFEKTYDEVWTYKLKSGTGVYGVFWDGSKLGGLGDIAIAKVDLINLFWESGITDIQKSRNLFHVQLEDNDVLLGNYPQLEGKLGKSTIDIAKYVYDDSVDTSEKSVVVEWYYKKNVGGREILHYCKYVNNEVLFATENDPQFAETGFYAHGKYPFIFDPLFRVEGTPAGFGYIDIGKSAQEYIDRGNQAIMKNLLANAKPKYFIRADGSVNEKEYANMDNDFIHVDGNLGNDSILPVTARPLGGIYLNIMQTKIDELKETTGNRDVSTGGTTSGVTAASAIAAMQESASKLSRDHNKASYRVYRELVLMVIELIRQFYDMPRRFRIIGEQGVAKFVQYTNAGIQPQSQGQDFGMDMGVRVPLFDVEITAEKQSPYSKMAQNELALQFYGQGFFEPTRADQALACLEMMDFDGKDAIMQKISQNGGMLQQMMMMAQMLDAQGGGGMFSQALAQQYGMAMPNAGANPEMPTGDGGKESSVTANARTRVAESTAPR